MGIIRNKVEGHNKGRGTPSTVTTDSSVTTSLVSRAVSGDFEAFGELYSIYLDRIYRYVFYQVRDKMTAEDITADVFLKALEAIKSCRGKEGTFSSWLYRIAHNRTMDNFRSMKRKPIVDTEAVTNLADPKQEVEKKVERQELLEVIAELPQNQSQVVILKFIGGLDNREIGRTMGKTEGAVRILQMRALAMLREKLGGTQ